MLLVRLLLREPKSRDDLIEAVRVELGDDGYPDAAASAFKHDLDALKAEFGCRVGYQRTTRWYALEDLGDLALLDLPEVCMEALASLERSFPAGATMPEQVGVRALLERVLLLLPESRREQHRRHRRAVTLDLPGSAPGKIDPQVLKTIRRACDRGQELAFDYLGATATVPRHHRVAPYSIFFRPEGHGYLDATLLEATPRGGDEIHPAISYRLDRIVPGSAKVLPQMLPKERPRPPVYTLRYTLTSAIALRRDVASYFDDTEISYHEDGSATVTASITNLWEARQILLRYGEGCTVLEPPQLVDRFRETAHGLAANYNVTLRPR